MSDRKLQMCKQFPVGALHLFHPAPTPTRTQKWTPAIFSSLFPAGPDTPRAEPGAAPADTAPALAAAASPEQTPPAPLQLHPRGSWRETLRPRLPTGPWQTDTGPASCSGLAPAPKPARRGLGAGGEATGGGLCHGATPASPPFWYGDADTGTSNQTWDSPGHPNSVMGKPEVQELPAWQRGCRLMPSHPCRHNSGTGHPVPSPAAAVPS